MEAVGLTQTAGSREATDVLLATGLSAQDSVVGGVLLVLNLPRDSLAALQAQVVAVLLGLTQKKTSFPLSLHRWSSFERGTPLQGCPEERTHRRWHPAGCTEEADRIGRN